MTPDEWASEYDRQRRKSDRVKEAERILAKLNELQGNALSKRWAQGDRKSLWRKQLVPGTVPARSADGLIAALGFEVKT